MRPLTNFQGLARAAVFLVTTGIVVGIVQLLGGIEAIQDQYGYKSVVILFPAQVLLSVAPFPSEVIAAAAAVLLGFEIGAIHIWLAWILAGMLEYRLFRDAVRDLSASSSIEKRVPAFLRRFPAESPVFLICGLWLPFGSHIVCGMAGAKEVDFIRFSICITIGYLPLSIFISGIANAIF